METGILACIDADNGIVECESNRQKKRSLAWDHFERLPTQSRSEGKAKCKHCETIFTATPKSGTSHLNRHVERCSKRAAIDVDPISVDFRFSDFDGNAQSVKLGKRVSKVWYEFELYPAPNMNDAKAKCKHCKIVLSAASRNGTSHLKRHLDRCIKRVSTTGNIQKYFIPDTKLIEGSNSDKLPKCATATATSTAKHLSTSTENLAEGSKSAEEFRIDEEELQRYITVCIVKGSHPFSLVEEKSFRSMMSKACPDFKPFNRAVVRKELFSMYFKERDSVKEILAKASGRICLTVSNWKARDTSDSYVRVAAHFVDDGWRLNRRILCLKALAPPYDEAFFVDELQCLSSQYGINGKTLAITMDEASHNESVAASIKRGLLTKKGPTSGGSFYQVGCCADLLNNMAQSTLKLVDNILDKIRELVKYVNKSPLQRRKFYDLAERTFQLQAKKRLHLDVPLRWNSTFKLIDRTLYYKNVFRHLVESRQELSNLDVTKEEWEMLSAIHKFLKVLYEVIRMFSVTNHPTSNLFLKGILMVHNRIVEIAKGPDSSLASAFRAMQAKLDDFWGQNSTILSCAAILDPRYKVKFVEYCHMKLHGPVNVEDRVSKVVDVLYDLFSEYKERPWCVSTPAVGSSNIDTNYVGVNEGDLFGDYDQFLSSRSRSQGTKSELDLYLEEPSFDLNSDLDVMKFWSISSIRYPDLSEMARDILSLPVSTVNSKEVFSAKTLSSVQSSVMPETLQALLCLQDWRGAPANSGDPTDTVEDPSGSSEDTEYDDEDDDSVLTDSF